MKTSKFQEYLDKVVEQATSEQIIKTAGDKTANIDVNNSETEGLLKIAKVVRSVSLEPSYEDLYSFVGRLYGQ